MRLRMTALLAALSMTALIAGGCANKEAVKTEEPAVATVKSDTTKPIKQTYDKAEGSDASAQKQIAAADSSANAANDQSGQSDRAVAGVAAFETVYFDFDKSDLRQDARDILSKNAGIMMKSKTALKLKIEGHCDERGSAEYNLALGERRAKSAMQYLITLGVQPDRLSFISYGKEKPAVPGSTEEAMAKNRRAEFMIDK
ncbi:MAG: peptidoglycan-associated lipoprotein Pal [Desulfuromonadales bacterium]|nr:peptidoglycan-associated lipoprotein Pal [Desulfuromonadales bacterium]